MITSIKTNLLPGNQRFSQTLFRRLLRKFKKYTICKEELIVLRRPLARIEKPLPKHILVYQIKDRASFLERIKTDVPHKYKLFKKRLEQDLLCFASQYKNGPIFGFVWFATRDYFEPHSRFTVKVPPFCVYQFDGFGAPQSRKGMLSLTILMKIHTVLVDNGYRHAIATVDRSDQRIMKLHAFLKFSETGHKFVVHYVFRRPYARLESYSEQYLPVRKEGQRSHH